jgi:XTP/dITP diphosphohydrolase
LSILDLIFASNNQHKVAEIQQVIPAGIRVLSLKDAGIDIDIPEPFDTLEENAREKCRVIYELTGRNCFSEDTGLFVDALHGEPGVKTARYAGEKATAAENIHKLLNALGTDSNRLAHFQTVICLQFNGAVHYFDGTCVGNITDEPKGTDGFGYDPVFIPAGGDRTFGEMNPEEKAIFSHRKKAVDQLVIYLLATAKLPADNQEK